LLAGKSFLGEVASKIVLAKLLLVKAGFVMKTSPSDFV